MSTLSLDLRGGESHGESLPTASAQGAGLSLLIHGALFGALIVAPLLGAAPSPETANSFLEPLVQPVAVQLPPPQIVGSRPPRRASAAQRHETPVVSLMRPTSDAALVDRSDVLDAETTSTIGTSRDGQPGGEGITAGDCAPGAICGDGTLPAASPMPTPTLRVGGDIKEPRLREARAPAYPQIAQAAGQSGQVIIEAHVLQDGRVHEARIVEGHPLFNEAAMASVRTRVYEPLLLNGVRTDFLVTITVAFRIR